MTQTRSCGAGVVVVGVGAALLLAACTGGVEPEPTPSVVDPPITLTVGSPYGEGLQPLYDEYEALHPDITIEPWVDNNTASSIGGHYNDWFWGVLEGRGHGDVLWFEDGWLGDIMEVADEFLDLRDYGAAERQGDFLDWAWAQGTDSDGRVIGYRVDIGPEGICFRQDLLAEAGIAADRNQLAEVLGADGGGWDVFFDVGRRYRQATGRAWFDQSQFIWKAMVDQLDEGYYTADGELNVVGNAELKALWDLLAAAVADGVSAGRSVWDWSGGQSFVDGTFATFVCPGWMLGVVQGNVEAVGGGPGTGWDFADVFPGGAANWAGAYLSVSAASAHPEEAAALASWLTEPEQQITLFDTTGDFPSTLEAIDELAANAQPHPFFNNAPVNAILASRTEGVVAQFKGPEDSLLEDEVFWPALIALDTGTSGEAAWEQALALLAELVDG